MNGQIKLPAWICKQDGRLEPFQPDQLSQSLFVATEHRGAPDVFLARELTEGVMHFLADEDDDAVLNTGDLVELTIKVVRELGHPQLARAYQFLQEQETDESQAASFTLAFSCKDSPYQLPDECLREYSRHVLFSRDIQSARQNGLLTLGDTERPLHLVGCVANSPDARNSTAIALARSLVEARATAGRFVILDSPDQLFLRHGGDKKAVATWVSELVALQPLVDRPILSHVFCATPPDWTREPVQTPLFTSVVAQSTPADAWELQDEFLEQYLLQATPATAVRVHLASQHMADPRRLDRVSELLCRHQQLSIAFDRPKCSTSLGAGLDRQHPAMLVRMGLHLTQLLEWPGVRGDLELFLKKLSSLACLAVSAAKQKRLFLQEHGRQTDEGETAINRQFLLARALYLVVPLGLATFVKEWTGQFLEESETALQLAQRIVRHLRDVLAGENRAANLHGCITLEEDYLAFFDNPLFHTNDLPARQQIQLANRVQKTLPTPTMTLRFYSNKHAAQEIRQLLTDAWKKTTVTTLHFRRVNDEADNIKSQELYAK